MKYLDKKNIKSELITLIKSAKKRIILTTYSLSVSYEVMELLKEKVKSIEIIIVYGNSQTDSKEIKRIEKIGDIKIFYKSNLHAKSFINEELAIISTMNLYENSLAKSYEMGILFSKSDFPTEYKNLYKDLKDIIHSSVQRSGNSFNKDSNILVTPEFRYETQLVNTLLKNQFQNDYLNSEISLDEQTIDKISQLFPFNLDQLNDFFKTRIDLITYKKSILKVIYSHKEYRISRVTDLIDNRHIILDQKDKFESYKEVNPFIKNKIIAVKLNDRWLNEYIILEEIENGILPMHDNIDVTASDESLMTLETICSRHELDLAEISEHLENIGATYKKGNKVFTTAFGRDFLSISETDVGLKLSNFSLIKSGIDIPLTQPKLH